MTITIGGLIKTTLVDFPARVAASIFLQGCNYRCGFCHNPGMIPPGLPPDPVDPEEVHRLLARRQGLLDGLCISGGEPLMQGGGLESFMRRVKKESGVAIKLDTNGSFPDRLSRMLDQRLVDYVALDIKAPPELYGPATGGKGEFGPVGESVRLLRRHDAVFELRTTLVPGLAGKEQLPEICRQVGGSGTYVLQRFRPDVTFDSASAALKPFTAAEADELARSCHPHFDHVLVRGF
jgi:pyruvate formate lyase activating enzyme